MTVVEIVGDTLHLIVKGIDVVLSFKKHMEIPLSHVTRAEVGVSPEAQAMLDDSVRLPGAYMPGIAIAGRFYEHGHWMFWNIHRGDKAVTIAVDHDKYRYLVVEVEDPKAVVDTINARVAARS